MYPCIEAIEWLDGKAQRIDYHQRRVDEAFQCLFPSELPFSLAEELERFRTGTFFPEKGRYKLRLQYDNQLRTVEFVEYHQRRVESLKLIEIDYATTTFKSSDRQTIDAAFTQRGSCDDVLLVRDGLLTDTSYANIAFFDGQKWISPRIPLLYGTRRAYLLDHQDIEIADIRVEELAHFQRIRLFNALIDFGDIDLPVASIIT